MNKTNETIDAINRGITLFIALEDLDPYELDKIQQAQAIIYRHKKTAPKCSCCNKSAEGTE